MTALTDRLDQWAALAEKATEGPWAVDETIGATIVQSCEGEVADCVVSADAAFITASRTALPATIEALRAVLDLHVPGDGNSVGYTPLGYRSIEPYCAGCEACDEYAVEWPCRTVRAIATALGVQP